MEGGDHCDGHPAFDVRFGGGCVTLQDQIAHTMASANDAPESYHSQKCTGESYDFARGGFIRRYEQLMS